MMDEIRGEAARRIVAAQKETETPPSAPPETARLRKEVARLRRLVERHEQERVTLQTLIDSVPDYLWVKDVDSNFVIANKAVTDDNRTADRNVLIGLNDFALHPRERAQEFRDAEQRVVRTGQPIVDLEEMIVNTQGSSRWLLTTKTPLRNSRGEIIGVVGISRDITQRKRDDELRAGEAQILEMIAMNAPLEDVLDRLMRVAEAQLQGIYCSTLLLDRSGTRLRDGAGPSL